MHGWTETTVQGLDSRPVTTLDESAVWLLLRALAAAAAAGQAVAEPCGVAVDGAGRLETTALGGGWLDVFPRSLPLFKAAPPPAPSVRRMLEVYLPLCVGAASNALVLAHMGQSLDGQIATSTGASRFITGAQDLEHMHRLRALFAAVVVGRSTVACDDPRLTTRLVAGENPLRVVLDPELHAPCDRKLFLDGEAGTLVLCRQGRAQPDGDYGCAEIAELPCDERVLPPGLVLEALRARGLRRIFIEGGGVTVSHFLQAGLLDRIHIVVSPVFLGQGRPGATLPMIDGLDQALRPRVRRFHLGEDVLFDCDLRG
jgi:diaminohydroxyphosphoribosylaminopyrimidine deaminase/5-amino-6-(5-phosphoribosylamino)uracil reductase